MTGEVCVGCVLYRAFSVSGGTSVQKTDMKEKNMHISGGIPDRRAN